MNGLPSPRGGPLAILLPAAAGLLLTASPADPSGPPTRALVVVRTLVIDALGTRTVDTDSARVPFGGKGMLIKKVPYAGPPLSFRLAVLAGAPQEAGVPLTLTADVWRGEASPPPRAEDMSHREEATVVSSESSYLFEIDHNPRSDRRIVLSIEARPIGEDEALPLTPPTGIRPVQFLVEITRESAGVAGPPDVHLLSAMVGRPVNYSSGVRVPGPPDGSGPRMIGLSVTLTPERAEGDLITVKAELSGAEFVDASRSRIEPLSGWDVRTVPAGARYELTVTAPAAEDAPPHGPPGVQPVTYRVGITPTLG